MSVFKLLFEIPIFIGRLWTIVLAIPAGVMMRNKVAHSRLSLIDLLESRIYWGYTIYALIFFCFAALVSLFVIDNNLRRKVIGYQYAIILLLLGIFGYYHEILVNETITLLIIRPIDGLVAPIIALPEIQRLIAMKSIPTL